MKRSLTRLFIPVNKGQAEGFSNEIKKTLAFVFNYKRSKFFVSADLLKMQCRERIA
jgi:hypothetical protein